MTQKAETHLALNVKIAATYLIVAAAMGIGVSLFGFGPHHPEFEAKSFAFKFGAYAREYTLNALFLISGIGIFRRLTWARKLGITVLAISIVYGAFAFAWGMAHGRPTTRILLISFAVVGAWNLFWIYLIYRKPTFVSTNVAS